MLDAYALEWALRSARLRFSSGTVRCSSPPARRAASGAMPFALASRFIIIIFIN